MTAQLITTDLITVADAEPGTIGSWNALGGGQSGLSEETDFAVQGSTSISKQVKQETKGMQADNGSAVSFSAGQHVYVWMYSTTPGALDTLPNGGLRISLGDQSNGLARDEWFVQGRELYRYGGWQCYVIDPTVPPDATHTGPTSGSPRYFGGVMSNYVGVRGINFGVDAIRYGTGIDVSGGGGADPEITFADISTENDLQANAWGVCQATDAGVQLLGELRIGADDSSSPTVFSDVDVVLSNPNKNPGAISRRTAIDFSGLAIRGSQTTASFTGVTFLSLDATDKGYLTTSASFDPTVIISGCTFSNWGSITLGTGTTISATKFKGSGVLTTASVTDQVTDCEFDACAAVAISSFDQIKNCSFKKQPFATSSAITTNLGPGTYSVVGLKFTDYSLFDDLPDSAINFTNLSIGEEVTLNASGCENLTWRAPLGGLVTVVTSNTLTLTGLQLGTEVRVFEAGTTTEVAGTESVDGSGVFSGAIPVASVDVVVHALGYLSQRLTGISMASDLTLPVQQSVDRQYSNPA